MNDYIPGLVVMMIFCLFFIPLRYYISKIVKKEDRFFRIGLTIVAVIISLNTTSLLAAFIFPEFKNSSGRMCLPPVGEKSWGYDFALKSHQNCLKK